MVKSRRSCSAWQCQFYNNNLVLRLVLFELELFCVWCIGTYLQVGNKSIATENAKKYHFWLWEVPKSVQNCKKVENSRNLSPERGKSLVQWSPNLVAKKTKLFPLALKISFEFQLTFTFKTTILTLICRNASSSDLQLKSPSDYRPYHGCHGNARSPLSRSPWSPWSWWSWWSPRWQSYLCSSTHPRLLTSWWPLWAAQGLRKHSAPKICIITINIFTININIFTITINILFAIPRISDRRGGSFFQGRFSGRFFTTISMLQTWKGSTRSCYCLNWNMRPWVIPFICASNFFGGTNKNPLKGLGFPMS